MFSKCQTFSIRVRDDGPGASFRPPTNAAFTPAGPEAELASEGMTRLGGKPPIVLARCQVRDLENVGEKYAQIVTTITEGSFPDDDDVIAFLASCANEYLIQVDPGEWASFGVQITDNLDTTMTPLDLLEVDYGTPANQAADASGTEAEHLSMMYLLLSLYRISKFLAQPETSSYRTRLWNCALGQVQGKPFSPLPEDVTGNMSSSVGHGWSGSVGLSTLIAAIDMFLAKFKTHKYVLLRRGSICVAYEDCAILSSVSRIMHILGDQYMFIFYLAVDSQLKKQLVRATDSTEEVMDPYSYMKYMRAMKISLKSPYSASENKELHVLANMLGFYLGNQAFGHSRIMENVNMQKYMTLAAEAADLVLGTGEFIVGIVATHAAHQIVDKESSELAAEDDLLALEDKVDPIGVVKITDRLLRNGMKLAKTMADRADMELTSAQRSRYLMNCALAPRPNTIGDFIKTRCSVPVPTDAT
jgi:hypothetical protein